MFRYADLSDPSSAAEASEARVLLHTRGLRAERQSKSAPLVILLVTSGVVNATRIPTMHPCRSSKRSPC